MSKHPIWFGFLSFSLSERRAIFVLVLILSVVKCLPFFLPERDPLSHFTEADWSAFQQQLEELQPLQETEDQPQQPISEIEQPPVAYHYFDPNTVSEDQLRQWNVPERVISTWINFRNAGATFQQPADIQKIYGLSTDLANALQPYIRIPPSLPDTASQLSLDSATSPPITRKDTQSIVTPEPVLISLDINQSEQEDWIELPGIGPAYAGRILRFREALGGFSSIDQIGETWHLPDSVFQKIKPFLVASAPFRQIAINEMHPDELAAHPYISQKQATILHRFRKNYGPFDGPETLRKTGVLSETDITRLLPYIQF